MVWNSDESPRPHGLSTAATPVGAGHDDAMTTRRKRDATTALLTADPALADSVISGHDDDQAVTIGRDVAHLAGRTALDPPVGR